MNICIPVEVDSGLKSTIFAHFGSAPLFMMVDTETSSCRTIVNGNQHHNHGMCMPLHALQGEQIDAIVVVGIGMGALNKLEAAGIKVYISPQVSVGEVITAFNLGNLQLMEPSKACVHHGHDHS